MHVPSRPARYPPSQHRRACHPNLQGALSPDIDPTFPKFLSDKLLPQTELTLNLLRQATVDPIKSVWEYFNGPFN